MLPGTAFPKGDFFSKIHLDKWLHFIFFAILVTLWCWGLYKSDKGNASSYLLIAIIAASYGVLVEFIQNTFIPYRSFEWKDIIVDSLGALTGFIISLKWSPKK